MVRERTQSRSPHQHDNLNSSTTDDAPSAGRKGQRCSAAPGPSFQQASTPRAAWEPSLLRSGEHLAGLAAAAYKCIGRGVL